MLWITILLWKHEIQRSRQCREIILVHIYDVLIAVLIASALLSWSHSVYNTIIINCIYFILNRTIGWYNTKSEGSCDVYILHIYMCSIGTSNNIRQELHIDRFFIQRYISPYLSHIDLFRQYKMMERITLFPYFW